MACFIIKNPYSAAPTQKIDDNVLKAGGEYLERWRERIAIE